MVEDEERKILDQISILLALERNYLAEERTALAEFRTGLALVLIAVPATGIVVFIFSTLLIERFLLLDLVSFTLFVILAILGIRISIRSQQRLKKIKIKMKMLHTQEARLLKSTKSTDDLLRKFIIIEERIKDDF